MVGVWPPKDMMAVLCERRRVLDAENGRVDAVFSRIQERRLSEGRHRGAVEALFLWSSKKLLPPFRIAAHGPWVLLV